MGPRAAAQDMPQAGLPDVADQAAREKAGQKPEPEPQRRLGQRFRRVGTTYRKPAHAVKLTGVRTLWQTCERVVIHSATQRGHMPASQESNRMSWVRWGVLGALLLAGLALYFALQSQSAPLVPLEGTHLPR